MGPFLLVDGNRPREKRLADRIGGVVRFRSICKNNPSILQEITLASCNRLATSWSGAPGPHSESLLGNQELIRDSVHKTVLLIIYNALFLEEE